MKKIYRTNDYVIEYIEHKDKTKSLEGKQMDLFECEDYIKYANILENVETSFYVEIKEIFNEPTIEELIEFLTDQEIIESKRI